MEGDDQQDPIADAARAILDGHIVLSRDLADAGQYPAIDIEASISRAQPDLLSDDALERTRRFKYLYSRYMRSRDLLAVGAYVPGADLVLDEGVRLYPRMQAYLMQACASTRRWMPPAPDLKRCWMRPFALARVLQVAERHSETLSRAVKFAHGVWLRARGRQVQLTTLRNATSRNWPASCATG